MIKAERNMRTNSKMEQIEKNHRKLIAINSLEKRMRLKGINTSTFEETKNTLKRNIEKIRRGL